MENCIIQFLLLAANSVTQVSEMIPEDQKEQSSVIYLFSKGLCKAMCVFMGPDMVSI